MNKDEKPPGEGWVWNEFFQTWCRRVRMDHFPDYQFFRADPPKPFDFKVPYMRFRYGKPSAQSK